MLQAQVFVERCRRWARIADALEGHPERDALFLAIQEIDRLYGVELRELTDGVHVNAMAAGTAERERLREIIWEQRAQLDRALAALVAPPPPGVQAEPTH